MAKLSREEMLQRLALLEEKNRRLRKAKPQYIPTPGQLAVLTCDAKEIFNFSGNGSGKTALNVQLAMLYARGVNPWTKETYKVPAQIAFVVDTSRKIDQRVIPEFRKWFEIKEEQLKKDGKPYTARLVLDNGSEIHFITADADPMSMEGVEYSVVIVDEPFPRLLYIALKRSLRKKGHANKLIFSGTAISEAWLRKDIFDKVKRGELPNVRCFNMKTEDNRQNLDQGYIESFASALTEAERKVRLEGGFFDTDALALAEHFTEKNLATSKEFRYDFRMPCVVAIDPHAAKPHTAVMVAADRDNRLVAIKEMSFRGNATQFSFALKQWEEGYNVVDRVCDSLGSTEMTSGEGMHSFIEGLQRNGIGVRAVTFKEKNHEDLIDRLRQGLALPAEPDNFGKYVPLLRIHEDCVRLRADMEQATWQKNRMTGEIVPKLDTSTKDYLSCLGYALAAGVHYDILEHRRSRPATERLPEPERREFDKHRARIKQGRLGRMRSRFIKRIARTG